ncbi:MAG: hypothetical protein QM520_05755 [Gammaproteobacteria bacterium]|nr:hypothetical protein [Gammaproteobacteria bacterium]
MTQVSFRPILTQQAVVPMPRILLLGILGIYLTCGNWIPIYWFNTELESLGFMWKNTSQFRPDFIQGHETPIFQNRWAYLLGGYILTWVTQNHFGFRLLWSLFVQLTIILTWSAMHRLAMARGARPVELVFGGHATSEALAKTLADMSVLLLISTLGLAQASHEVAPYTLNFFLFTLFFWVLTRLTQASLGWVDWLGITFSLAGLAVCTPTSVFVSASSSWLVLMVYYKRNTPTFLRELGGSLIIVFGILSFIIYGQYTSLHYNTRIGSLAEWYSLSRLMLWFSWPSGLLALWLVWKMKNHLFSKDNEHILLPLSLVAMVTVTGLVQENFEQHLLLVLSPLACLASFSLVVINKNAIILLDWMSILLFSLLGMLIWVIWGGILLSHGFIYNWLYKWVPEIELELVVFDISQAVLVSLLWIGVFYWRLQNDQNSLWHSVLLPVVGVVYCLALIFSLGRPFLEYARSYKVNFQQMSGLGMQDTCVYTMGMATLSRVSLVLDFKLRLENPESQTNCPWFIVHPQVRQKFEQRYGKWELKQAVWHPTKKNHGWLIYHSSPL